MRTDMEQRLPHKSMRLKYEPSLEQLHRGQGRVKGDRMSEKEREEIVRFRCRLGSGVRFRCTFM